MDKIEITFQDKKYTLEYNRYSIVKMEKDGFDVSKADKQPLSTLIGLSRGAFIMHHPELKPEDIDLIIDAGIQLIIGLATGLVDALPKLINDYGSVSEPAPSETQDDYGIL